MIRVLMSVDQPYQTHDAGGILPPRDDVVPPPPVAPPPDNGPHRVFIGKEDLDKTNLQMKIVRHYMKKGRLLMLLKRVSRAGQFAFRKRPEHARLYHLDEVEPPWASASSKRSS